MIDIVTEYRKNLESLRRALVLLSDERDFSSVLIIDRHGATLNTDVSLHNEKKIAAALGAAYEEYYRE
jgi:hypothetical protein